MSAFTMAILFFVAVLGMVLLTPKRRTDHSRAEKLAVIHTYNQMTAWTLREQAELAVHLAPGDPLCSIAQERIEKNKIAMRNQDQDRQRLARELGLSEQEARAV